MLFCFPVIAAFMLFIINGLLGDLQSGKMKDLFEYGHFGFSDDSGESFANNFFSKVISPTIFVSIVCAILEDTKWGFLIPIGWTIVPLYWLIRVIYISFINRWDIVNKKYEAIACLTAIGINFLVFLKIIMPLYENAQSSIFIPIDELRDAVWYAIIAFLAKKIWDVVKANLTGKEIYPDLRKGNIVDVRYDRISKRYGNVIESVIDKNFPQDTKGKGNFSCLVYAIAIYEDYNRPPAARMIEKMILCLRVRKSMTLGIMQVNSTTPISDEESIKKGVEKLCRAFVADINNDPVFHAITAYNGSEKYLHEVLSIYETLLYLNAIDELIDDNEAFIV